MAFKHCISFATDLAANFDQNHAWHRFQAFARRHLKSLRCLIRIWVDALSSPFPMKGRLLRFESNRAATSDGVGQVVDSDLLPLCTGFDSEHEVLILCHIFAQRPMNDRKIGRSDGCGFGRQQLLGDSIEIFISHKKVTRRCPKFTKH